jgi:hypothetical protein
MPYNVDAVLAELARRVLAGNRRLVPTFLLLVNVTLNLKGRDQ